jgi:hypothetical protein
MEWHQPARKAYDQHITRRGRPLQNSKRIPLVITRQIQLKTKMVLVHFQRNYPATPQINKQSQGDDKCSMLSSMVVFKHSKIATTVDFNTFVAPCWYKISSCEAKRNACSTIDLFK